MTFDEFSKGGPVTQVPTAGTAGGGNTITPDQFFGSNNTNDHATSLGITTRLQDTGTLKPPSAFANASEHYQNDAAQMVQSGLSFTQNIGKKVLGGVGSFVDWLSGKSGDPSGTAAAAKDSGFKSFTPGTPEYEKLQADTTNDSYNAGDLGFDVASLSGQIALAPEVAVDKLGLGGLTQLAEKGYLTKDALQASAKFITSKWGQKAFEVLTDFAVGAGTKEASNIGGDSKGGVLTSGVETAAGGQILRPIMRKLGLAKGPNLSEDAKYKQATEDIQKITNPTGKYTPTEKESLYKSGETKTKGAGVFKKDVANPNLSQRDDQLLNLHEQGKISTTNTPGENIAAMKQEARTTDYEIDQHVKNPKLDLPFNQNKIDDTLNGVRQAAQKSRIFISKSAEESAYNDVIDIAQEQLGNQKYNNSGLRQGIKNFNGEMEDLLGNDIYADPEGRNSSVSNARVRAAQDVRTALNNTLADNMDRAQQLNTLKAIRPEEATPLIDKAENFNSADDFVKNQRDAFRKKLLDESSYRAEKRRIDRSMARGMSLEDAWEKEGLSADVDKDLNDIWKIAHTETQEGGGSAYKNALRKEAQLLNAADETAHNSRGELGKSKAGQFYQKNKDILSGAISGAGTFGVLEGGKKIVDHVTGQE